MRTFAMFDRLQPSLNSCCYRIRLWIILLVALMKLKQNNGPVCHKIIYVHSKVKPSMKKKYYNVEKRIRESEDIFAAACTFPAG